jgi:hypothetical protein
MTNVSVAWVLKGKQTRLVRFSNRRYEEDQELLNAMIMIGKNVTLSRNNRRYGYQN